MEPFTGVILRGIYTSRCLQRADPERILNESGAEGAGRGKLGFGDPQKAESLRNPYETGAEGAGPEAVIACTLIKTPPLKSRTNFCQPAPSQISS